MAQAKSDQRGRVLLVGKARDTASLGDSLSGGGFEVSQTDGTQALDAAADFGPDAIVVMARADEALATTVRSLREDARTQKVPVLLQGPEAVLQSPLLRGLPVDELLPHERVAQELERRLAAMVRAKRLVDNEERTRGRLQALLEISQAAASTLDENEILHIVVRKLAEVVQSDRCAILLVEKSGEVVVAATVEAPELGHRLRLDLSRYPELALALQSREAVVIADAHIDPRMAAVRELTEPLDVRSILVQPVLSGGELQGAIFLRQLGQGGAFDDADRDFARGVAAAVGDHLRNARLHADLRRARDELESAYVDRYRELASANRRLKELNQFKDELIAMCSHDLRAPLNVVLGHGQLLQDAHGLSAQDKASIDAIVRQGKKILELVESLLEKGKGEADRHALEPTEIDLARQTMDAARELDILAKQKGLTLRAEAPGELWAMADRIKVRQVLQNLIQNAIGHARTKVTLHAERVRREGGDQARLSVCDDGPGIPEGELAMIFDRYRHGKNEGTGLGLSICREFVELHGGEIWAENAPEGGACFRILLPLSVDEQVAREAERPRVLLVEDEPAHARVGVEILRTRYRVELARDGAEGLAKARALKPDAILLDVFLPRVDGLDAAAALRKSPDTANTPIIMLATHPSVESKVRGLHLGVSGYVGKPFEARALLGAVEGALDKARGGAASAGLDVETGFLDAAALARRATQEEARARRYGRPLSVVVVAAGKHPDEAQLTDAARLLRAAARPVDVVGHLGSGTFAVVLPECDGPVAEALAERLAAVVKAATGAARAESAAIRPGSDDDGCAAVIERLSAKVRGRRR